MTTNELVVKGSFRIHVRWLIRRDMDQVSAIESLSMGQHAWDEERFTEVLRKRNCIGMACEVGELIVGFMVYELHKSKLNVLSFAVHPDWRRKGVGTAMIDKLISKLSGHRRSHVDFLVRENLLDGQLFLRSRGFKAVKVDRWAFGDEAGYWMRYAVRDDKTGEPIDVEDDPESEE